ncbi:MAG: class I SAM-dependent methyltransferase [Bacteroidota bacterium]
MADTKDVAQHCLRGSDEERYTGGYGPLIIQALSRRHAVKQAAFFLPHLRSGMSLLDCGCGPGVLTVDLAEVVAPSNVVGIDINANQFEVGKAYAKEKGISNIRFEVGDVYDIPFPDSSFDAAFAHAVLYHLSDPRKALREVLRVLRPGGIVGVRDADSGGNVFAPSNPTLDQAWNLIDKVLIYNGGNPVFGSSHRAVLHEVGFVRVEASASYDSWGTPEATQKGGEFWADFVLQPQIADVIMQQGWATRSELDRMSAAFKEWGEHPDAFFARTRCEAVGWKE